MDVFGSLSTLSSEDAFLSLIDSFFPSAHQKLLLGRGDDCAVLGCSDSLCVSTDLFLENVHFRRTYFSPADIGYKALAVNISDIAAMGAVPSGFVLNLMVCDNTTVEFWAGFFQGMSTLAEEYGMYLAGGDLSRFNGLGAAVTVWGEQVPGGRYLQRGHGRCGDVLFVVGDIGLARTGLAVLEGRHGRGEYPTAVQAHLRPAPKVTEAGFLATVPAVRGLMDVSDGLIRDMPRFLGPGLGCRLTVRHDDLHPEVLRFAAEANQNPVAWALLGGEEYALLGAVAPDRWTDLCAALPQARRLGLITGSPGIFCNDVPVRDEGFDHFQGRGSDRPSQGNCVLSQPPGIHEAG